MDWNIVVAKAAQKQVAGLPAREQEKIAAALLAMAKDPFSGDVLKLAGEEGRCGVAWAATESFSGLMLAARWYG
jgi:hypothetical protein